MRNLGSTPSQAHTTGWVVMNRGRPINTKKGKDMNWGEDGGDGAEKAVDILYHHLQYYLGCIPEISCLNALQ